METIPTCCFVTSADVSNDMPFVDKLVADELNRRRANQCVELSFDEVQELRKTLVKFILLGKNYTAAMNFRTQETKLLEG
jgi:hypothetical protein